MNTENLSNENKTEALNKHVVMQGLPYYQLCPKCFGEGIVDNPYARGTSSIPTRTCPVCNGAKTFYHGLSGSPIVGQRSVGTNAAALDCGCKYAIDCTEKPECVINQIG